MSRRKCRILAFQTIFAWEANAQNLPQAITDFSWISDEERAKLKQSDLDWARLIVCGTIENIAKVDEIIKSLLVKWELSRIKRVDLAILRISVYSLLYQKDIPPDVVIQEAVNIALEFGEDDSFKFINGILDSVKKECDKL
ncbi:MAG: transcription antitermination factor NusB [Termitinemataceae bacterium]|nr:MAG: transcription antitermination factor NusB [Termitinemataceae bacterium]